MLIKPGYKIDAVPVPCQVKLNNLAHVVAVVCRVRGGKSLARKVMLGVVDRIRSLAPG